MVRMNDFHRGFRGQRQKDLTLIRDSLFAAKQVTQFSIYSCTRLRI